MNEMRELQGFFQLNVKLNGKVLDWKVRENSTIQSILKYITKEFLNGTIQTVAIDKFSIRPNPDSDEHETVLNTTESATLEEAVLAKPILTVLSDKLFSYVKEHGDVTTLNWTLILSIKKKQRAQARSASEQLDLPKVLKRMSFLDKFSLDDFHRALSTRAKPVLKQLFVNEKLQDDAQTLILQNLNDDQVNELFDKLEKNGSDSDRRALLVTLLKVQKMWNKIWDQLMDTMSDELLEA